ncbi:MAG: DegT/DnrJ/EryC1/StrS family aminotransferase [Deltaproteobacteria bacterium]|nr:DegT/DnrJ/EryC1/StrS family aminotransferase [Candidatus Zymogenaceae bacterium]
MKVPLLDLKAQYATIRDEVKDAVDRVISSQYFVLGPEVEALEAEIAAYTGAGYGVGVASGSDAILLAMMERGLGPGDAVVTTPYSFFATAGSVTRTGASVIFVDIDPVTFNMDPGRLDDLMVGLTKNSTSPVTAGGETVRGVMPVHLFGQTADMASIAGTASRFGLFVVEDAAQAIGSRSPAGNAGAIGRMGCFSFFPSKNLGGFGDGGMITTSSEKTAEDLKVLRNHGSKPKYYHRVVGVNSRLDALQAAVLRVKLKHLDAWTEGRRNNADRYRSLFTERGLVAPDGPVTVPIQTEGCYHIYNQFVIMVDRRDDLRGHLSRADIGTEVYYPVPLHLQECYRYLGYNQGDFPHAETAAQRSLALPIYPELTADMQQYIADEISVFYGGEK